MHAWFEDGRIIVVVLVLIVCEFLLLMLYARQRPGLLRALTPTLAAGALLAVALGARQLGADWRIAASLLALAGVAHVVDVFQRWKLYERR